MVWRKAFELEKQVDSVAIVAKDETKKLIGIIAFS